MVEAGLIRVWLAWIEIHLGMAITPRDDFRQRYGECAPDKQPDQTWLRPLTGRSHQLRAHLAGIGHPILGDPIYGEGSTMPLRLHARALSFQHPFTGRRLRVFTRQDDDNNVG